MEAVQTANSPSFETVWAILQEVAQSQKETDRQMKETTQRIEESQKETNRQMKETTQRIEESQKETA